MSDGNRNSYEGSEPAREKVLIVHPALPHEQDDHQFRTLESELEEAEGLARAINLDVIGVEALRLRSVNPSHLISKGVRERLASQIEELEPTLVIVNHNLSPIQQRNLEKDWQCKVIDRTGLILEIFGERAQTREGKIQVELAALEYQKSRLVRSWTHLERQRGGAGFMGGPGETQLEIDRRIITDRITRLKKDLEQVKRTRELARKSRERVPYPIVALVGYTNAGKSTLFNTLTGAGVFAEDLPFATLDPTMRKLTLKNGQDVILSDTVGFIENLPTHLVAAFRSTLEQVRYADVILHIRDIARPDTDLQKEEVIRILNDLGVNCDLDPRVIEVCNKVDALEDDDREEILRKVKFQEQTVAISALKGEGTDNLLELVERILAKRYSQTIFEISPADGKALSWLYRHTNVLERDDQSDYISIKIEAEPGKLEQFMSKFPYKPAGKSDYNHEEQIQHADQNA